MKKHITTILLAIIGLTFISFMANDSVMLRFKPTIGKTMTCQTKSTQIMTMNVQGQSMNTNQTMEMKAELTAKEANKENITCDAQLKYMKLTQSAMGMTMVYDSEHPEKTSPLLAGAVEEYGKALNKTYQIVFDPMGNIVETSSEKGNNLPNFSAIYPEESVTMGSQWTSDLTQDISGVEVTVKTTYTVTKITKKETTVSIEGTMNSNEVNGTNTGSMVIDNATGLTKTSTIKTNMSMTIEQQGLSIPVTVNGTTNITIE